MFGIFPASCRQGSAGTPARVCEHARIPGEPAGKPAGPPSEVADASFFGRPGPRLGASPAGATAPTGAPAGAAGTGTGDAAAGSALPFSDCDCACNCSRAVTTARASARKVEISTDGVPLLQG